MTSLKETSKRQDLYFGSQAPILPNAWQGEVDSVVGPFSSQLIATYFANGVVDFGHYEVFSQRIFAKRDAWYIEVQKTS